METTIQFKYAVGDRVFFRHLGDKNGRVMVVESLYDNEGCPRYVLNAQQDAKQFRVIGADENRISREGENDFALEREWAATAASGARSAFLAQGPWREQRTKSAKNRWQHLRAQANLAALQAEKKTA